jgi:uncharacterized LabA/DUF88 family protein
MAKPGVQQKQVYAFIDSQNLNVSVQKFGWKMDWQKLRKYLSDTYGVTKAYMFIGYVPEFESMYVQLHEAGYSVVLKPTYDMTKPRPDAPEPGKKPAEDEKKVKGNIDAELVLWAMKEINNYDSAIIVSGDGDFFCLVEYLDEVGKLLKILTPTWQYSSLYNKYEQYVVRLDQSRKELAYRDRRKLFKRPK